MKLSESDLLEKWLEDPSFINWAKEANQTDVQKWDAYLAENPAYRSVAEMGQFALLHLQEQPVPKEAVRSELALQKLKQRLHAPQPVNPQPIKKQSVKVIPFYRTWPTAAAVLLLIGLSSWLFLGQFMGPSEVVLSTNYGESKNWTLADESKVTLNANSTLKYNPQHPRKVWLDGEAFFEVAKKTYTGEQFQVLTKDLTVNVLGTIFNVNSRHEQTQVFLEEGKVSLALAAKIKKDVAMLPGEMVSYSKKQAKLITHTEMKILAPTSWLQGIIRFEAASLATILQEVSAIYGIQFEQGDLQQKESLYSGGIPTNNLEITLKTIEEMSGLSIEKVGKQYNIKDTIRNE